MTYLDGKGSPIYQSGREAREGTAYRVPRTQIPANHSQTPAILDEMPFELNSLHNLTENLPVRTTARHAGFQASKGHFGS